MSPVLLDAHRVNLPMRVIQTETMTGVDRDGCPLVDTANACVVRGLLVTVGHISPVGSMVQVVEPWSSRIETAYFKKTYPWHDAAILDIKPGGPEFEPAPPVIGENVVMSHFFWDDAAGVPKFVMAAGRIVELVNDVEFYDPKTNCPLPVGGVNVHTRYGIRAPNCPKTIRCGSSVTNRAGQLVGIINGTSKINPDVQFMSSIVDILDEIKKGDNSIAI